MFDEKELSKVFGPSDEGFKNNFEKVLTKLQTEEKPYRMKRPRLRIAAIAVAMVMVLSLTAYAVEKIFVERADVGASWVFVSAPEDYYEISKKIFLTAVYNADADIYSQPCIDTETAQILRDMLNGMIFNADGEPIDILSPIPDSEEYRVDMGENVLYNELGEELWAIRYKSTGYSEPEEIWMETKTQHEELLENERNGNVYGIKRTNDYDEAVQLLGSDFALPGIYTDGFEEPEFRYQKDSGRKAVYVTYKGTPGIYYFAEMVRNNDTEPYKWYADATIEQCELKNTTLYKATNKDMTRYLWTYDGVIYMIFKSNYHPYEFTEEQFIEIIESMIK